MFSSALTREVLPPRKASRKRVVKSESNRALWMLLWVSGLGQLIVELWKM